MEPVDDPCRVEAESSAAANICVYLFTDLVGSLDFKRRLGDTVGHRVLKQHDERFRELLSRYNGSENKDTGDGFLATFNDASGAVRFALEFQSAVASIPGPEPLSCRIGLYEGHGLEIQNPSGATNQRKMVGLDVDLAARLTHLALPRQILLSGSLFDRVRRMEIRPPSGQSVEWLAHGSYRLKGTDQDIEVFEVGLTGFAPLKPPSDNDKMRRANSEAEEVVLGWRPSVGGVVPHSTDWRLVRQLGQGGVGEVWLVENVRKGEEKAFKFCFSSAKLRLLRREHTLFRLMREVHGRDPSIARLDALHLEAPPFRIEMEYLPEGDLASWAERRGGIASLPLGLRLELIAQTATAVFKAHQIGILHKDIKPANILIRMQEDQPTVVLADFGIGALLNPAILDSAQITASGFTRTLTGDLVHPSSGSGTTLYMAPEAWAGGHTTVQSDIYALGVLLYQVVLGDFRRPLGHGWECDIEDLLLRADIADCIVADCNRRLSSALQLAQRLRRLSQRRAALEAEAARHRDRIKAMRRQRILVGVIAAFAFAALTLVGIWMRETRQAGIRESLLIETRAALEKADYENYKSGLRIAEMRLREKSIPETLEALLQTPEGHRNLEWGYLARQACEERVVLEGHRAGIRGLTFSPTGKQILTYSEDATARIWDSFTGKVRKEMQGHKSRILHASFSPDGSRIVTASDDHSARIWSGAGEPIRILGGHSGPVNKARFNARGDRVITCSDDGTAKVWDGLDGHLLSQLIGHTSSVFDATFSPDGSLVGTASDDGTVRIWNGATAEPLQVLDGHEAEVNTLIFSPDGRYLASGSQNGKVVLWECEKGGRCRLSQVSEHHTSIRHLEFNPQRPEVLVVGETRDVILWDLEKGRVLHLVPDCGETIETAKFDGEGNRIAVASRDRRAYIFSREADGKGFKLDRTFNGHEGYVTGVSFSPPGDLVTSSADGTARIWPRTSGGTEGELAGRLAGDAIESMSLAADGQRLAVAGKEGGIGVFSLGNEITLKGLGNSKVRYKTLAVGPGNNLVAACTGEGNVEAWNLETGTPAWTIPSTEVPIDSLGFSSDGQRLITGDEGGFVRIWAATDAHEITKVKACSGAIARVQFLMDGFRILAFSAAGEAAILSTPQLDKEFTLPEGTSPAFELAFSEDASQFVTHEGGQLARVWNSKTADPLTSIRCPAGSITAACFSPDGSRIATGSSEGCVYFWSTNSGEQMLKATLQVSGLRPEIVDQLNFSGDGSVFACRMAHHWVEVRSVIPWPQVRELINERGNAKSALREWIRMDFERRNKRSGNNPENP